MAVGIAFTDGKCIEALHYYCNVFGIEEPKKIIRYSDFEKFNHPKEIKNRIYNSYIDIYGNRIYLYDVTNDRIIQNGNNVRIVIETSSDNLYRAYMNFRKDSTITMEPQKINKKLFTTLVDKYNISWQFIAEIKE
ncbi:hypothetical protein [uncultured Anaerococcus sp.]|uniref:hypothetical protein n=1 Tax=uncultured Anaerococcus sp. TaxID=293428 RepID=UPI0026311ECD|nr:hypothetical protein [uncultured Anaerococcus sp.]